VANCITIRGSFVGTRQDMVDALDFAVRGKVKADIEVAPLSSINEVFQKLQHGDVASRIVLDFAPSGGRTEEHSSGPEAFMLDTAEEFARSS
jgi:propanol-preferring alcohol dehydrogenase